MQGFAPKGVHGTTSSLSSSCEFMFTVFHGEDLQLNYIAAFFSMSKGLQIILFSDFETFIQQLIRHCGPVKIDPQFLNFVLKLQKVDIVKNVFVTIICLTEVSI